MAKNLLFALLFCISHCIFSPIYATNEFRLPEISNLNAEVCNAPAPDSFRITGVSSNFISLAWRPAWVGATHTLVVLEKDGTGGWDPLYTFYNVLGHTYTVYNLQAGHHYRFIIATNCSSGESSELKAIIDGIALIVDLTINGRTPISPKTSACSSIPLDKSWIGFKVVHFTDREVIENHFELKEGDSENTGSDFLSHIQVAREKLFNPIVAIDSDDLWPTCAEPSLSGGASFLMARLKNGGPDMDYIGWVDLIQNSNPPSIQICPNYFHPNLPWDNDYSFTALEASNASTIPGCGDRSEGSALEHRMIKIQSPFNESLNIFLPSSGSGYGKTTFRLLNTNGQIIMVHHLEVSTAQVSFPVKTLAAGVYILQIQSDGNIQTVKVIKS